MNACKAAGTVKRVVVTSSVAAVQCLAKEDTPAGPTYTEHHWSNPDRPGSISNYHKSKL